MKNNDLKIKLLNEEIGLFEQSLKTLLLSVDKCTLLIKKNDYTFEDMESFDSLTSKFGRTSDIYTQKILRTIWMLLREPYIPFIDMVNKAEKIELIDSADEILEIRDLRNEITHEYIPQAITELVPQVIDYANILQKNYLKTFQFIKGRSWLI
jgi:hypothetical protein